MKNFLKIGIAPQEKIRERVLAIAKGEIKPKTSDPKIWFTSEKSVLKALFKKSYENPLTRYISKR
mgnify:CR=1 FL=1|jgi:predicted transcriptional regulator